MQGIVGFEPLPRTDIIYFHKYNRSLYANLPPEQYEIIDRCELVPIIGEQGYLTCVASHGVSGRPTKSNDSSFYFEVEILPPKTPLPFVNVKPAVRVGLCNLEAQDCDKPLGSNPLSYAYASTGKLITGCKCEQNLNKTYCK